MSVELPPPPRLPRDAPEAIRQWPAFTEWLKRVDAWLDLIRARTGAGIDLVASVQTDMALAAASDADARQDTRIEALMARLLAAEALIVSGLGSGSIDAIAAMVAENPASAAGAASSAVGGPLGGGFGLDGFGGGLGLNSF